MISEYCIGSIFIGEPYFFIVIEEHLPLVYFSRSIEYPRYVSIRRLSTESPW